MLPVKVKERCIVASLATDSRRRNDGNLTVWRRYKHSSSPCSASASFPVHFPDHFPVHIPRLIVCLLHSINHHRLLCFINHLLRLFVHLCCLFNHLPMTASLSAPLAASLLATIVAPLAASFSDNCGVFHGVHLGLRRRDISISAFRVRRWLESP